VALREAQRPRLLVGRGETARVVAQREVLELKEGDE
jgi:hypothetical protein